VLIFWKITSMDTSKNFIQWNCIFTGQRPSLVSETWARNCGIALESKPFTYDFSAFIADLRLSESLSRFANSFRGNGLRFLPIVDLKQNNQMGSKLSKYIISIEKNQILCNFQWFQYLAKALRCYQFEGLSMRTANFNYQKMGHSSFPSKQQ
jgi:hypothetical protein